MKRLPIIPTLIVAAAVAAMIGLGIWQLQRAQWKERMLAELARTQILPPIDLDAVAAESAVSEPIAFRRVTITCDVENAAPQLRAGRNLRGGTGYSHYIPCRRGAAGLPGQLQINAGWSQRPDSALRLTANGRITGLVGSAEEGASTILTADSALGPLEPSAPPRVEDIPNNHLAYAGQWFFFALAAAIIYVVALRGRRRTAARRG